MATMPRLMRAGKPIAVAMIAPATQPSWKRVSKRAKALPREVSGVRDWTRASNP